MALFKKNNDPNGQFARLGSLLEEAFGDAFTELEPGLWRGFEGSTVVFVRGIYPEPGVGIVVINAMVLRDVALTPALTQHLLTQHRFLIGRWELEEENGRAVIFFGTDLPDVEGSLTAGQLEFAASMIASSANEIDDDLQRQFGGKLASED